MYIITNISKYVIALCGGGVLLCDLQGLHLPSGGATVCDAQ